MLEGDVAALPEKVPGFQAAMSAGFGTLRFGSAGNLNEPVAPRSKRGLAPSEATVKQAKPDYSTIENPENVGPGKEFTLRQKQEALAINRAANGGVVKSDLSGEVLIQPQKSQRGVTPSPREWQFDHKQAKDCGGTNCSSNLQILSREENRLKSNR